MKKEALPADDKKDSIHGGHRERVKELFLKTGLDSFTPHAALELLLYYAVPRRDTNPTAHALLRKFGSLSGVFDAPLEELEQVEGVGRSAAILLRMIPQLCRLYQKSLESGQKRICDFAEAGKIFTGEFLGIQNEAVMLMLLDSRERILFCGKVSDGSATAANIYVKTVASLGVRYNAVYAILAHNHPSGSCMPSRQDLDTTRWVYDALNTVEIRLIDHIIVGGNEYFSMAQSKILPELFNPEEDSGQE